MVKTHQNNPLADLIGMNAVVLMAIGTVFVFSADANISHELDWKRFYQYQSLRQIVYFPFACAILYAAAAFNYRRFSIDKAWLRSPTTWWLVISIILLVIVLVPSIGTQRNYARRWLEIPIGPAKITFQPSELAKWATIFFVAAVCCRFGSEIKRFFRRFLPVCAVVGLVVGLVVVEDLGTAAFISLLAFLILLAGGVRWWHALAPLPLGAAAFAYVLINSPARMSRITAFLHPDTGADAANYQANQSLIAISSGGLWGKGLGRGICKYGHLPEDTTDFVFAIIGEELGFVGSAAVILLFVLFVCFGLRVVVKCKDRFGKLLAAGITLAITIQAALNIGVVTVVLPTKGIPLPFVSAGGTSMLLCSAAVGVLVNIAQQTAAQKHQDLEIEQA